MRSLPETSARLPGGDERREPEPAPARPRRAAPTAMRRGLAEQRRARPAGGGSAASDALSGRRPAPSRAARTSRARRTRMPGAVRGPQRARAGARGPSGPVSAKPVGQHDDAARRRARAQRADGRRRLGGGHRERPRGRPARARRRRRPALARAPAARRRRRGVASADDVHARRRRVARPRGAASDARRGQRSVRGRRRPSPGPTHDDRARGRSSPRTLRASARCSRSAMTASERSVGSMSNVDRDDAVVDVLADLVPGLPEHRDHPAVLRQHLGGEPADPALARRRGEVLEQHRAQPAPVVGVGDVERDLGRRRRRCGRTGRRAMICSPSAGSTTATSATRSVVVDVVKRCEVALGAAARAARRSASRSTRSDCPTWNAWSASASSGRIGRTCVVRAVAQDDVGLPARPGSRAGVVAAAGARLVGARCGRRPRRCRRAGGRGAACRRAGDRARRPARDNGGAAHQQRHPHPRSTRPMARRTATARRPARGRRRDDRRHRRRRRDGGLVPRVRLLGHLLARPARRPRRPQAGAAPDPLPDGRHGPAPGPRAREVGARRRRGHGQAAPARRHRDLRRDGPHGAAVLAAPAAGRRARQLRLARRRPGRPAVHRGAPRAGRAGDDRRASTRTSSTSCPNYDNKLTQPEVLPAAIPNLLVNGASRHRGRHGDEHGAAQPRRGRRGGPAPRRAPRRDARGPHALRARPRPAHGRQDRRPRRRPRRLPRPAAARSAPARPPGSRTSPPKRKGIVITELPYLVGPEKVIEKIKEGVQSKKLSGHLRRRRPHRPRSTACAWSSRSRPGFNPEAVLEQLYRLHPARGLVLRSTTSRSSTASRAPSGCASCSRSGSSTGSTSCAAARRTGWPSGASGCTWSRACSSRSSTSTRSSRSSARPTTPTRPARGCASVFDLSEPQAEYILELRLRRLTKFSRIELEKEQRAAASRRSPSSRRSSATTPACAPSSRDEMAEVAAHLRHPAPHDPARVGGRHGVTGAAGGPRSAAPLEIADTAVLGAAVRHRAARPHGRRGPPGARRAAPAAPSTTSSRRRSRRRRAPRSAW